MLKLLLSFVDMHAKPCHTLFLFWHILAWGFMSQHKRMMRGVSWAHRSHNLIYSFCFPSGLDCCSGVRKKKVNRNNLETKKVKQVTILSMHMCTGNCHLFGTYPLRKNISDLSFCGFRIKFQKTWFWSSPTSTGDVWPPSWRNRLGKVWPGRWMQANRFTWQVYSPSRMRASIGFSIQIEGIFWNIRIDGWTFECDTCEGFESSYKKSTSQIVSSRNDPQPVHLCWWKSPGSIEYRPYQSIFPSYLSRLALICHGALWHGDLFPTDVCHEDS